MVLYTFKQRILFLVKPSELEIISSKVNAPAFNSHYKIEFETSVKNVSEKIQTYRPHFLVVSTFEKHISFIKKLTNDSEVEFLPFIILLCENDRDQVPLSWIKLSVSDYIAWKSFNSKTLKQSLSRLAKSNDLEKFEKTNHTQQNRTNQEQEVLSQNTLLKNVINSSHDGIINLNSNFEIVLLNPASELMFKCKATDAVGLSIEELLPNTPTSTMKSLSEESLSLSNVSTKIPYIVQAQRLDKSVFVAEISCSHFKIGSQTFYTILARDITEKLEYETEICHQRANLLSLIESTKDAILMYSKDGVVNIINPAAKEYFETVFHKKLNIGDCIKDKLPASWLRIFNLNTQRALKGFSTQSEAKVEINNQVNYFDIHYNPILQENTNNIISISFFARNITHQKTNDAKIQDQALYLDQATNAITACDTNYKITFWNKGAQQLFGYSEPEVTQQSIYDIYNPSNRGKFISFLKKAYEHGEWLGELVLKHQNGQDMQVQCRISLILDELKNPKAYLLICSDVTQKKQIEQQLMRSQRVENIGMLAGGVAHDLNNILSPILLSSQLLKYKLKNSELISTLDTIEQSAQRGSEIVKQILSFTRSENENKTLIQIRHLTKEINKFIKDTFPKNIQVHLDIPNDLPYIESDSTELHQVLLNLCVNARDAMPDGGELKINVEEVSFDETFKQMNPDAKIGKNLMISISDTGVGMPANILDKIFDPFFTTKPRNKGTGLGLFTVHNIIKKHNGFITVFSKEGEGTTLNIYFPTVENQKTTEQIKPKDMQVIEGQGETILIIEDEPPIRKIMTQILESKNFKVITAENGAIGLEKFVLHKNEINLIITDLMMPVMDGASAIMSIHHIDPTVKIVAVSGEPTKIAAVKKLNIAGYIQKPFNSDVLLKMLAKVFNYNANT